MPLASGDLHALLCSLTVSLALAGEPANQAPVRASLLAEADAIVPGRSLSVALQLEMAPGYHVYWRNPGTVGLAPRIQWELPEGFQAGPLQWPTPELCRMSAYQVWGYRQSVLLLTKIAVPEELETGQEVVLKAEAMWMGCSLRCHPQFQLLELSLPVRDGAAEDPLRKERFDQVRRQQHHRDEAWSLRCFQQEDRRFLLRVEGPGLTQGSPPRFFGFDRLISSSRDQRARPLARGWEIEMHGEEFSPAATRRLTGILTRPGGWKEGAPDSPLLVDVPIEAGPPAP